MLTMWHDLAEPVVLCITEVSCGPESICSFLPQCSNFPALSVRKFASSCRHTSHIRQHSCVLIRLSTGLPHCFPQLLLSSYHLPPIYSNIVSQHQHFLSFSRHAVSNQGQSFFERPGCVQSITIAQRRLRHPHRPRSLTMDYRYRNCVYYRRARNAEPHCA